MKLNLAVTLFLLTATTFVNAQALSHAMEKAITACRELSIAIENGSTAPLKAANTVLKNADIINFGDLTLIKGKELDLNGHFIFDEVFVDSIIVNRKVWETAQKYVHMRNYRGTTGAENKIRMTTKGLKAGQSAIWKTVNRGNAEFAVVAEPGGLLTMTICDNQGKVLYAETTKNKQGLSMRKAQLQLPDNKKTVLHIKITNHSKQDASFAFLKN